MALTDEHVHRLVRVSELAAGMARLLAEFPEELGGGSRMASWIRRRNQLVLDHGSVITGGRGDGKWLHMRARYRIRGAHARIRLFAGSDPSTTFANVGELSLESEFEFPCLRRMWESAGIEFFDEALCQATVDEVAGSPSRAGCSS